MIKQFDATIYGRVQGVSFRFYTRNEAAKLGITGWVANQRDGSVKVVAQGSEEALQSFIAFLHRGPTAARVDQVDLHWQQPVNSFSQFQVRWL